LVKIGEEELEGVLPFILCAVASTEEKVKNALFMA